eukprot:9403207-Alexandrium_andersonii.AAC.1
MPRSLRLSNYAERRLGSAFSLRRFSLRSQMHRPSPLRCNVPRSAASCGVTASWRLRSAASTPLGRASCRA